MCWCNLPKIIKISPCLSKLQLAKVGAFFESQCSSIFQSNGGIWICILWKNHQLSGIMLACFVQCCLSLYSADKRCIFQHFQCYLCLYTDWCCLSGRCAAGSCNSLANRFDLGLLQSQYPNLYSVVVASLSERGSAAAAVWVLSSTQWFTDWLITCRHWAVLICETRLKARQWQFADKQSSRLTIFMLLPSPIHSSPDMLWCSVLTLTAMETLDSSSSGPVCLHQ